MPDASGRIRGIAVPRVPWHEGPQVGQRYGMWVFDDQLYVKFTVTSVNEHTVEGRDDDDGAAVSVGLKRLADTATRLS